MAVASSPRPFDLNKGWLVMNVRDILAVAVIGCVFVVIFLIPIIIGFAYILPDANRRGQPGLLWAVVTIPFNWTAVIAYLIVRAVQRSSAPQ
jgi:hypothetical protein